MTFVKSRNPGVVLNELLYRDEIEEDDFDLDYDSLEEIKKYVSDDMKRALDYVSYQYYDEELFEDIDELKETIESVTRKRVFIIAGKKSIDRNTASVVMSHPKIYKSFKEKKINGFRVNDIEPDQDTYEYVMSGICDDITELHIYAGLEPKYEVPKDDKVLAYDNYRYVLDNLHKGKDVTNIIIKGDE